MRKRGLAKRIAHVGHGQQALDFGQPEHVLGQPLFHPGQLSFADRPIFL